MSFILYLIDKRFTPYRKTYNRQTKKCKLQDAGDIAFFSSMVPGYLDIQLIKNDCELIWGLCECSHPPTLIYPRPNKYSVYEIDRLFLNSTYDEIFNMITNNGLNGI